MCDDVLRQGVQGIAELITVPGLINVDFADVKAIMQNAGSALMGVGVGTGENRALEAAKAATTSPLLELSIDGAKGILFTVVGGVDLGMHEINEAAKLITQSADPNAKIIFGAVINESMKNEVRITVVATGFHDRVKKSQEKSVVLEPTYRPSTFLKKERLAESELMQKPKEFIPEEPAKTSEEEELEIPAFIRKKIRK